MHLFFTSHIVLLSQTFYVEIKRINNMSIFFKRAQKHEKTFVQSLVGIELFQSLLLLSSLAFN